MLGGLVNHSVQRFIKGCLTLKFSGSWKTVISSSDLPALLGSDGSSTFEPLVPLVGETGMVSRGTGEVGFAPLVLEAPRFAMMTVRCCQ